LTLISIIDVVSVDLASGRQQAPKVGLGRAKVSVASGLECSLFI